MGNKEITSLPDMLDKTSRDILGLFALGSKTYYRQDIRPMADKAKLLGKNGKKLPYKELGNILQKLLEMNLLETGGYSSIQIRENVQDLVVQDTIRRGRFKALAAVVQRDDGPSWYREFHPRRDQIIAFYKGESEAFFGGLSDMKRYGHPNVLNPFNRDIFNSLPSALKEWYLLDILPRAVDRCDQNPALIAAFEKAVERADELSFDFLAAWLDLACAQGSLESMRLLEEVTEKKHAEVTGCIALLEGDHDRASKLLCATMSRGKSRGKLGAAGRLPGFFCTLLLFADGDFKALEQAETIIRAGTRRGGRYAMPLEIVAMGLSFKKAPTSAAELARRLQLYARTPLSSLAAGYIFHGLLTEGDISVSPPNLKTAAQKFQSSGFEWLAAEARGLAEKLFKESPSDSPKDASLKIHERLGTKSLVHLLTPEATWQLALNAAVGLAVQEGPSTESPSIKERMIWEWDTRYDGFYLTPFHQVRKGSGWSKGRKTALSRLYESHSDSTRFGFLTDEDIALCKAVEAETYRHYRYYETTYIFNPERAARALIGHPRIFPATDRERPIDIVEQAPALRVTQGAKGSVSISVEPQPEDNTQAFKVQRISSHRVAIVSFSETHLKLHRIFGGALKVPKAAANVVLESVQKLSSLISVQSDIGGAVSSAEKVDADSMPHIHLTPYREGLQAEIFVYPLGENGPVQAPGQGGESLFAEIDGRSVSAARDLEAERSQKQALLEACPALAAHMESATAAVMETAEDALDALVELESVAASGRTALHWPKGKSLTLAGSASPSSLHLHIRKDRDYFAASGSLKVDAELSLDLLQLIELIEASPSRYAKLDDGRFLLLTDKLRRRVEELSFIGDRHKKQNKLLFPPVRAAALDGLDDTVSLKTDKHFKDWIRRIQDTSNLEFEVPSTLATELRDYQTEGFRWAARLAAWGVGACLADDMGLGKTVTALALLIQRAKDGPALVVAPASVAHNWMREAARFAPTLNVRMFGEGDRTAHLAALSPFDVAVCTYGLLHTEAELLGGVHWHTVVLDEAQLIKNEGARRSQAAKGLTADFRLIMTGTPLENHLGELWNLFEFINPGLLGPQKQFLERFASPQDSDIAAKARKKLKRLIQPFILRRTKSQVLDELPSRTEIVRKVVLSDEEAALYEALRHRAVEKLGDAEDGASHLQILAEITRLRRACCHPSLALPDCKIASAKEALFCEIVDELIENHHKVLVFSQFVDHLKILEKTLIDKKIAYQYLDGSTPLKKRKERIDAFQAGKGDVFLISLKAGGLGLNLTAADFVIHMDPWWNPAVEDQASDRAHRLGQKRPVTVYRFIAQGTVEEKISALHKEKRALADSLLEGADVSGKLSAKALLALIRE